VKGSDIKDDFREKIAVAAIAVALLSRQGKATNLRSVSKWKGEGLVSQLKHIDRGWGKGNSRK
jgi:hypothetical protein